MGIMLRWLLELTSRLHPGGNHGILPTLGTRYLETQVYHVTKSRV